MRRSPDDPIAIGVTDGFIIVSGSAPDIREGDRVVIDSETFVIKTSDEVEPGDTPVVRTYGLCR